MRNNDDSKLSVYLETSKALAWRFFRSPSNVATAAVWLLVGRLAFLQSDFFDDSFIYAHIASNIAERWTAQYFPVANNPSLLASSPLHLFTLLPGALLSRGLGLSRTLPGFKLSLLVSAFMTIAATTWYVQRVLNERFLGRAFAVTAALLLLTFDSALQMEGTLMFAGAVLAGISFRAPTPSATAAAAITLLLTRVEYGLAYAVTLMLYVVTTREWSQLWSRAIWLRVVGACVVYLMLCASWGVWPIPTTFLTKMVGANPTGFGLVGPVLGMKFLQLFGFYRNTLIPLPDPRANAAGLLLLIAALVLAVWQARPSRFVWGLAFGSLALAAVAAGGANFLWYYDNVFIFGIGLLLVRVDSLMRGAFRYRIPAVVTCAVAFAGWSYHRAAHRTPFNLVFTGDESDKTMGNMYVRIAHLAHDATFASARTGTFRLDTCEIGAIAYFAKADSYFHDTCDLAQSGDLLARRPSLLMRLYPDAAFALASKEWEVVARRRNVDVALPVRSIAWSVPDPEACLDYGIPPSQKGNICLK